MNPNKLILSSRHYDEIGAFSLADEIDDKLIKQAQSWAADPNLPEPEADPGGSFQNIFRAIGGQFKRNLATVKNKMANDAIPNLNSFIISNFSKDPANNDFQSALWSAKKEAQNSFGKQYIDSVKPNWILVSALNKKDLNEIYFSFINWVNYQRQILGPERRASAYLRALKNAENIIAKKIDPNFKPKAIVSPTSRPSTTTPSGGRGTGGGGRGSGGGSGVSKPSVKPSAFNVNEKLFDLIYIVVKGYDKDTSFADMNIVYDKIKQEPMLKEAILDKIKSSKYTPENKEKLRKKFLEKIGDREYGPEPGPTPPEPTPPGPTPPSPSPSDQDVRPSPFLHDEVRKLSELDDREFMKVFESKSTILSRQIMSSYTNRILLPEEYTYLIGAIDRMKLRFQRLLQGM